jgi:translation initiation factor IF-1
MVKNVSGGSGQKSKGRKYEVKKSSVLRIPEEEGEEIGYVIKNEGGGICRVMVILNKEKILRGHIRGKFRSRNRKDNNITAGSMVMIGLRDWEEEKKECDILEVYDQEEIKIMKSNTSLMEKINRLQQSYQTSISGNTSNDRNEIEFTMDVDEKINIDQEMSNTESEINIDDI